ncbi:MAG: hypothetical protein MI976_02535 [Pseudomonadales bacterium]|nr:hypothetical protein [Pseudomonadales bacterium]
MMSGHFFSDNPGKAWSEKFFLIYSPIWMIIMGLTMLFGGHRSLGDVGFLVLGLVVALPFAIIPAFKSPENQQCVWYQTYWFKANVYIFLFSIFGNYFGSEYFFDVLGMVYNFPNSHWTIDAALVGEGKQVVPIIMYLLTHAYFMTYHVSATVVIRKIMTLGLPRTLFPLYVFVIGYFWAWMETAAMANPLMAESFYYEKMERMLAFGSAIYAIYFIASFPIFYFIDEKQAKPWSLWQASAGAMSASMLTFFGLDFAAHWIGSL